MNHHELIEKVDRLEAEVTRLREERIPRVDRSSRRRDQRLGGAFVLMAVAALGLAGLSSASALAGTDTVFSDDIVDGTVSSLDVKNNAIITSDIKDSSIASRDIGDGTVAGVDIMDGSLTGAHLVDGTVSGADVTDHSLTGVDINLFDDAQCSGETILGTAAVNADPSMPSTPNTDWVGWSHSCSGEAVRVSRGGTGLYIVDFGTSNPARLAAATPTEPGAAGSGAVIVVNLRGGQFRLSPLDSAGNLCDCDFSILAY